MLNHILMNLISFTAGVVFGWLASRIYYSSDKKFNGKNVLLVVVALAWVASIFAEIINPAIYTTPVAVHAIMGAVVGSLFKGEIPFWGKK